MKRVAAALLLGLFARDLSAHSIETEVVTGGIGILARYADGTPAAFAEAKVFAPGEDRPFQEGLTDREGRFLFLPPTSGTWRIVIDDGMGHAIEQSIQENSTLSERSKTPPRLPRVWALVTGISLIWGLFGTWGWWRAQRR